MSAPSTAPVDPIPTTSDMCDLVLRQAVDTLANWKCAQAIKAGKLRLAHAQPQSSVPILTKFTPRMNLIDDAANNVLIAIFELPGIRAGDLKLELQDGNLIIKGQRHPLPTLQQRSAGRSLPAGDNAQDDAQTPVHEIRCGMFYRAIPVAPALEESDVSAHLEAGMLTVTFPKAPNGHSRTTGAQGVARPTHPSGGSS